MTIGKTIDASVRCALCGTPGVLECRCFVLLRCPEHCGYQFRMGALNHGGGCEQQFSPSEEVYRCLDCGGTFHKGCLQKHFEAHSGETKESLKLSLAAEQSAHRRTLALVDALVAALPKCTMPGCDGIATRAYERGRDRFCDGCGGLPHTREAPDYARATPLRAWLRHREEAK